MKRQIEIIKSKNNPNLNGDVLSVDISSLSKTKSPEPKKKTVSGSKYVTEARLQEFGKELKQEIVTEIRTEMNTKFEQMESKFDKKFEQMENKFEQMEGKFDQIENKFDRLEKLILSKI